MADEGRQDRGSAAGSKETWPATAASSRTMFNAPVCADLGTLTAQVAFLGVPFDQGTIARPGARFGPNALRDAEVYNYYGYLGGLAAEREPAAGYYDIDAGATLLRGVTMADCGNVNVVPSGVELSFDRVTRAVRQMLGRDALPVLLGGDHAITYPAVSAFDGVSALDVLHFDAHMDYVHDYQGVLLTHGSPIRRCAELPFVRSITSIGVRVARREPYEDALRRGNRVITADRFRQLGPRESAAQVPSTGALYVTVDVDVLDPTVAPGTGAPVAGGLTYLELREALRAIPSRGRVVGFDVVEVAPPYDVAGNTAGVAAKLVLDLVTAVFSTRSS